MLALPDSNADLYHSVVDISQKAFH